MLSTNQRRRLHRQILGFTLPHLFLVAIFIPTAPLATSRRDAIVEAVEKASPAVVNMSTMEEVSQFRSPSTGDPFFDDFFRDFFAPREKRYSEEHLGSGVIIDPKGYILTNYHVITGVSRIKVTLADERTFFAEVVGGEPDIDLAILKIESGGSLPTVPIGTSSDLMIGEKVIAIGNPFGLDHTVTAGVVSAVNRSIRTEEKIYNDFIQTDASINPGNSGGPLLNSNGELIGINTAIYRKAQGIGFAIPIDKAKRIMDDLIRFGEVIPPWTGIEAQDLTEGVATYFGVNRNQGIIVTGVVKGSPATKAGLREGDIVLSVDRNKIDSVASFRQLLKGFTAGDEVPMLVLSDGRKKDVTVVTTELPLAILQDMIKKKMGLAVTDRTEFSGRLSPYAEKGVVIDSVVPNGQGDRIGIRRGDIVLKVFDKDTPREKAFYAQMKKVIERNSVVLLIQRGRYAYYITFTL